MADMRTAANLRYWPKADLGQAQAEVRFWHKPAAGGWAEHVRSAPGISDINLFRYCQRIVHFDAQISNGAFDLGVAKQKLDSPEIASATIDQGCLSASERMRSK
jgi:hypothetical protein